MPPCSEDCLLPSEEQVKTYLRQQGTTLFCSVLCNRHAARNPVERHQSG
jgi:hypothetical protein